MLLDEHGRGAHQRRKQSRSDDNGLIESGYHEASEHHVCEHTVHGREQVHRLVGGVKLRKKPVVINAARYLGAVDDRGNGDKKTAQISSAM